MRTADGTFVREKVDPGFGDAGSDEKRNESGLGEPGRPTSGAVEFSVRADTGSGSEAAVAAEALRWWAAATGMPMRSAMVPLVWCGVRGDISGVSGARPWLMYDGTWSRGTGGGDAGA